MILTGLSIRIMAHSLDQQIHQQIITAPAFPHLCHFGRLLLILVVLSPCRCQMHLYENIILSNVVIVLKELTNSMYFCPARSFEVSWGGVCHPQIGNCQSGQTESIRTWWLPPGRRSAPHSAAGNLFYTCLATLCVPPPLFYKLFHAGVWSLAPGPFTSNSHQKKIKKIMPCVTQIPCRTLSRSSVDVVCLRLI